MAGADARSSQRRAGDARAQAGLVGLVLLTGLVITGSVVVVALGQGALDAGKKDIAVGQARNALTELDARTGDVALGVSDDATRTVSLGLPASKGSLTRTDRSWMRIRLRNVSTDGSRTVVNQSLGTIRYRRGRTAVAYEGGGVWRSDGDGSVMIAPPEFHFRNGTLTVPILSLRGDRTLSRRVRIERASTTDRVYPNATTGLTNEVTEAVVTVTVHSEYYRAWGRYLGRTTHTRPRYDDPNETATVSFVALPPRLSVAGGIVGTASAGQLELRGHGAYTDSYDSTQGPYADTRSGSGTVVTSGDISLGGGAEIDGNVRVGGQVTTKGKPTVRGNVAYADPPKPDTKHIRKVKNVTQIDGVPSIGPVDDYVSLTASAIRGHDDNARAGSAITDGNVTIDGGSHVLRDGQYAVDTVDISGGELVFDTTDGDVYLVVRDWIQVTNGDVLVEGNGTVHVVVASRREQTVHATGVGTRAVNLYLGQGGHVRTPGQDATQFLLFAPQDFRGVVAASRENSASLDGLVYAPAGRTGSGDFYLKQAEVYGGVVAGSIDIGQYGAVHYDQALVNVELPRSPGVARIGYMYVSTHYMNVTNG